MRDFIFFVVVALIVIYLLAQPNQQAEINKCVKAIYEVYSQILAGSVLR